MPIIYGIESYLPLQVFQRYILFLLFCCPARIRTWNKRVRISRVANYTTEQYTIVPNFDGVYYQLTLLA
jgi:hypothetical protein